MNPSTTALTLNMQLPNIATVSWAVQGDQLARIITATLVDGSTPWTPEASYHGVVRFHKPDGTSGVYDVDEDGNPAVTWTGNVATVTIAQQALTCAGSVVMQLEFYDTNNARITAFGWINNVQPSAVTDTEFLSTDYYNILTLQIAAVLEVAGEMTPYSNTPEMDGTGSPGTSLLYSRGDHVHPTDTSRIAKTGDTATGSLFIASNNIDTTELPTANQIGQSFGLRDKNNIALGSLYAMRTTTGANASILAAYQAVAGVTKSNFLLLGVDSNGDPTVSFTDSAAWRKALGLCYAVNDTMPSATSGAVISGKIESNLSTIFICFNTPKSMENISTITVTAMTGHFVGVDGAVDNAATATVNFTASPYSISCVKLNDNFVRIGVTKSSAYGNASANTPVAYFGTLALKFT